MQPGRLIHQLRRQLAERLVFDLSHAFAGQAERLADFLERFGLFVVKAESHA